MFSDRVKSSLKREFQQSLLAKVGLVLVVLILFAAVFAPFLSLYDPDQQRIGTGDTADESELPPWGVTYTTSQTTQVDGEIVREQTAVTGTAKYPLGTNTLGQDIYSRLLYGARVSMLVGILGAIIAALVGVPYGLMFPSLVLAIALVGIFRETSFHTFELPDPFVVAARSELVPNVLIPRADHVASMPATTTFPVTVAVVVALVNWVWFARVARGEAYSIRSEEYVKAARSLGGRDLTILRKHVFPNAVTPIIVLGTIQVAFIILLESALSFLGFSGTDLTWGADIADGRSDQRDRWWIATLPGVAIVLAVVGVNLLGDWLRDALDPSIQGEGGA
ncbi:ABC transporter permease [Halobacteriales archaeon QH_10_67_13]|nr:MAG: ABC transporter permease [Halobacteriales archaeon QH_10_67_13]